MIPLIGELLGLVDTALDKIWPDADTKEKAKADVQLLILKEAIETKKLAFVDSESARKAYQEELAAKNVPAIARFFQVMARPFTMYAMVSMYVLVKVGSLLPWWEEKIVLIQLTDYDYYLLGTVFVFLFGARTIEKVRGKA